MENNTPNNTPTPNKKGLFSSIIWLLITIVMVFAFVYTLKMDTKVTDDEYYQIVNYFDQNKIKEYSLNLSSRKLTYVLKGEKEARSYTVPNVQLFVQDVHEEVREYNKENPDKAIKMNYEAGTSTSWVVEIVPMVVITILLCVAFYWLLKKMNNTMMTENNRTMAFGKARLKSGEDEQRKTTFEDVAGVDEEKEDLQEIVEFLKNPEKFRDLGARIPKGVLLVGPPGTGKTLLARAVAGEADATFLSISGSDFVEMYVGVGASRVRDLFDEAKKNVPSIIFIDEIDAVGRHRGAGMGGGHDEREQTLNQLLVEMDGFGANVGVIIIAATNRPDILDPALLRPGRFDRQVTVNYPDVNGREAILKVHAKNKPIGPDVSLSEIARATSGFTGADLENLLNEAALLAARRNKRALTKTDIEDATIKVVVGTEKKSKKVNDEEKKLTAYHEAGHAITNYYLNTLDPVHQISIIPRGMAGGYTMSLPKEDKSYVSKNRMLDELVTLLGGRVAEAIILGDISTGASNDIERATGIARKMITKYGMSEKLGPITYGSENDEVFLGKNYNHMRNYSEDTASAIDSEISNVINDAYNRAEGILREHSEKLHKLAEFLIRFEKIDGPVFEKLMKEEDFSFEDYEKTMDDLKRQKEARAAKAVLEAFDEEKVEEASKSDSEALLEMASQMSKTSKEIEAAKALETAAEAAAITAAVKADKPDAKKTSKKADGKSDVKPDKKDSKKTDLKLDKKDSKRADKKTDAKLDKDADKKADKKGETKLDKKAEKKQEKTAEPKLDKKAESKAVKGSKQKLDLKAESKPEPKSEPIPDTKADLKLDKAAKADKAADVKLDKKAEKKARSHKSKADKKSHGKADDGNDHHDDSAEPMEAVIAPKSTTSNGNVELSEAELALKAELEASLTAPKSGKDIARQIINDDIFDGSEMIDDSVNNTIAFTALATDAPAEVSTSDAELELPNEPFVSRTDKQSDTLPGMDAEIESFNNEPLNIGSFINSMTNFNTEAEEITEPKSTELPPPLDDDDDFVNPELEEYGEDFNYEAEKEKGNFTENDEIYALYELLKQTRDFFGDENSEDEE